MKILLIAGGWSNEREVALSGAAKIRVALDKLGHDVRFLDPAKEFNELMDVASEMDFAFINLHGAPGEDGLIQAMLEQAGCPYQGTGPTESFLTLNKAATKQVFRREGLPTPDWELFTSLPDDDTATKLTYPVFVKPNSGGSSVGMSLVRKPVGLRPALELALNTGDVALVEEYKPGVELTCAVIDGKPLPIIMIVPRDDAEFFDYENKYAADGADEICPAPVDEETTKLIQDMAVKAHNALGLTNYSRSDFIMCDEGAWLLEVNTLPGMTPTSLLPKSAAAAGLDYTALVGHLIDLGLKTNRG